MVVVQLVERSTEIRDLESSHQQILFTFKVL